MFWMIECLEDAEELLSVRFFFIVPRRWSLDCCRVVFSCSSSRLSRLLRPRCHVRHNKLLSVRTVFFLGVLLPGHGPQIFSGLSFRCPSPSPSPSPSPHRSLATAVREASMSGRGSPEGSNRSQSCPYRALSSIPREEFKPRGSFWTA